MLLPVICRQVLQKTCPHFVIHAAQLEQTRQRSPSGAYWLGSVLSVCTAIETVLAARSGAKMSSTVSSDSSKSKVCLQSMQPSGCQPPGTSNLEIMPELRWLGLYPPDKTN